MPFDVTIKCPHCEEKSDREIAFPDMQAPFLAKCRNISCKKYFAVKITFSFEVESAKIFDGANNAPKRDEKG